MSVHHSPFYSDTLMSVVEVIGSWSSLLDSWTQCDTISTLLTYRLLHVRASMVLFTLLFCSYFLLLFEGLGKVTCEYECPSWKHPFVPCFSTSAPCPAPSHFLTPPPSIVIQSNVYHHAHAFELHSGYLCLFQPAYGVAYVLVPFPVRPFRA